MSRVIGLKCRECGAEYEANIQNTCYECFGPLEVHYDWDEVQNTVSKEKIAKGPVSIWRYADLLPIDGTNYVVLGAGYNKLHQASLGIFQRCGLGLSLDPFQLFHRSGLHMESLSHTTISIFMCDLIHDS